MLSEPPQKNWSQYGGEFSRFLVVGLLATLVHLLVYWSLNAAFELSDENKLGLSITYSVGYLVSFVGNYIISLRWTFRTEGSVSKGLGFAFSHLVNYGMHVSLLNLFLWLGFGRLLGRVLNDLAPWLAGSFPSLFQPETLLPLPVYLIVVPVNFLLVRFFLKHGDKAASPPAACP
ncbi:MAG: GtrA family protein [Akkermansiaceae bacterium]|nr:GtrA family protein [Akkermansiaceae bacterium]